jgi:hypothetical protein
MSACECRSLFVGIFAGRGRMPAQVFVFLNMFPAAKVMIGNSARRFDKEF